VTLQRVVPASKRVCWFCELSSSSIEQPAIITLPAALTPSSWFVQQRTSAGWRLTSAAPDLLFSAGEDWPRYKFAVQVFIGEQRGEGCR
jgi:hypothetical protein